MTTQWGDPRLPNRFWKSTRPGASPDDCWEWIGVRSRGYGRISLNGRPASVHRAAYEAFVGVIPAGLQIDHMCHDPKVCQLADECPHRSCVNPQHLRERVTTARENILRSGGPAARLALATHCVKGHEFTAENTYWRDAGRQCKTCRAEWSKQNVPSRRRPDFETHCPNGHARTKHGTINSRGFRICTECNRLYKAERRKRQAGAKANV